MILRSSLNSEETLQNFIYLGSMYIKRKPILWNLKLSANNLFWRCENVKKKMIYF